MYRVSFGERIMTTNLKAIYEQGALRLFEPIELEEGSEVDVIVISREPRNREPTADDHSWNALETLVNECAMDTGISDLAHQHDHYLYGTSKKD